jgi:hypothetical protein
MQQSGQKDANTRSRRLRASMFGVGAVRHVPTVAIDLRAA